MKLGLSRWTRIVILLVIDINFFLIELISGYTVGSLALVADSFHMLNDIISLIIALYAMKLANASANSQYSYGWHRAEILAALVNGVFLLALCFSIFMEAIEKFINTPAVSNPQIVAIVGCCGLVSNFVGLALLHDHSHGHGHSHSHGSDDHNHSPVQDSEDQSEESPLLGNHGAERTDYSTSSTLYAGHPVQNRQSVLDAAEHMRQSEATLSSPTADESSQGQDTVTRQKGKKMMIDTRDQRDEDFDTDVEGQYVAAKAGSMNMRALVLHVLGDALGNVGVIATGLVIWLTDWKYRFYFDPMISLFITCIIFSSAMPLVKSTSFILLQGVPPSVSLDRVRNAIRKVPGVLSLHELHVWQLSESRLVASVHVIISAKFDYMDVQTRIRRVLHNRGMHSSTIQPEVYQPGTAFPEENLKTEVNTACLLAAADQDCCSPETACCPPGQLPHQYISEPASPTASNQ